MLQVFIFATMMVTPSSAVSGGGKTITQVVTLLQEMLDKSKEDGASDRTVYAKFKCYCDSSTKKTEESITTTTDEIERMEAIIADKSAMNTALSQEANRLETDMAANQKGQGDATATREKENEAFVKEEADLVTGIKQLDEGIDILAAVGADQTVSGDTDSELAMAADATATAKGSFMAKKSVVKALDMNLKEALRAASVFLDDKQRSAVSSFLQAPFTGNYNAQSGEIVGVLKNMNDTFTANLANARQVEAKALAEYDSMMKVLGDEYSDMSDLFEKKKTEIGDTGKLISKTSSELSTAKDNLAADEEFLAALTARCASKKAEFDKRNMLRSEEEAAIAEAIAVLNSDAAFETFGKVSATSTGSTSFIQLRASEVEDVQKVRANAAAKLARSSKELHSVRLAKIAMELSSKAKAENPFTKVLEDINGTLDLIDAEEADDVQKKDTCEKEQTLNNDKRDKKKDKMDALTASINDLQISADNSRKSIDEDEAELALNRQGQASETATRNEQNAQFLTNKKNLEDAERILAKATKVLVKYYKFLHSHSAEKTYEAKEGVDSGGGNMKQVAPEDAEELCSEDPECVAYNSAGWLKSSLQPENDWYSWDGGTLYLKKLDGVLATEAGTQLIQTKVKATAPDLGEIDSAAGDAELADSQSTSGNKVIDMLTFIASETTNEKNEAIKDENSAQKAFDDTMAKAKAAETKLLESIDKEKLALANTMKDLQEDSEELATTTDEHTAIVQYLADIEPGCTFIQTEYQGRHDAREAEKTALKNAIDMLKATPIFQQYIAEAEKEAMGKCAPLCEGDKEPEAECQACLQGVSVFGYCVTNPDTPGCPKD